MAGQRAKGGRLSAGKTASALRAVYSLLDKNKADEPRASGGPTYDSRAGKIELPQGAATRVPEVPELAMKQLVRCCDGRRSLPPAAAELVHCENALGLQRVSERSHTT